ncbi:T9SS type A sorting domain-containing protein [Gaetbulibacter saemankumensis]|uniref:T9SS type A sorting domain-containing protein n=1 Tax=Gaetbulibacter saemankumensis TaxID=311208 RepID=UPI0004039D8E|nr:T9SS type A sorting domain-containing protein [Gaetbulibacter saemankumensis]
MKKITLLNGLFLLCSIFAFGQVNVEDFDGAAPYSLHESGIANNNVPSQEGWIATEVVANPNPTGLNTTANCLKMNRLDDSKWPIYQGIDVNPDMVIGSSDTKFVSVMVLYTAQPDIAFRFNATDDVTRGAGVIVRALNAYDNNNLGEWQEIVFEIKDDGNATFFTLGTLYRMEFYPDAGFVNDPAGKVLSSTVAGYLDQIQILDSNPLLSNSKFELNNNISLYPNPAQSEFTVTVSNNTRVSNVSVYNALGSVVRNVNKITDNTYDISKLSTGLYFVKVLGEDGSSNIKRLIKN